MGFPDRPFVHRHLHYCTILFNSFPVQDWLQWVCKGENTSTSTYDRLAAPICEGVCGGTGIVPVMPDASLVGTCPRAPVTGVFTLLLNHHHFHYYFRSYTTPTLLSSITRPNAAPSVTHTTVISFSSVVSPSFVQVLLHPFFPARTRS
jgi:hypothetical protein